jgi:hypothetical protein
MKKIVNSIGIASIVTAAVLGLGAGTASAAGQCGSTNGWGGVNVAGSASCGFALNVARGLSPSFSGSSTTLTAYSPATGLTYNVNCWRKYQKVMECQGGSGAVIYLVA